MRMNIIERQAEDFYKYKAGDISAHNYKDLVHRVKDELLEYPKTQHQVEFLARVIVILKKEYDQHEDVCNAKVKENCRMGNAYQNALFFLQEELEELETTLQDDYFTFSERKNINTSLEQILTKVNEIQLGQKITYDDIFDEIEDLKSYYYLSKKHWIEMLLGKLTNMIASGVVSETASKKVVEVIQKHYPDLLN